MDVRKLINHALKQVTPYFNTRIYPKGGSIFVPGTENSSSYLLLEGTAKVYQYTLNDIFISSYRYGKSNYFGEMEPYCESRTILGVSAVDTYGIVKLSRKGAETWIHEDDGFCKLLFHQVALKIVGNSDAYIRSSSMELKDRVLYCLHRRDRMRTLNNLTKERLMNKVYTPIHSLNRVLAQHWGKDLVTYNKHRFRVVDRERFLDAADKLVGDQR